MEEATWDAVESACCIHNAKSWVLVLMGVVAALFFLYFFLFALKLLGSSNTVMGGCSAGAPKCGRDSEWACITAAG